ncbi:hypothetical protein [Vibrio furnissii]|uniref:hypothetical protein n=1 Tax=Vibrio furnissii TaxID=29494 RepID=UPI00375011EA
MESNKLFFGLHGLKLPETGFDLGNGVVVRETYAHIFAPFMVAFSPPQEPTKHHSGPWSSALGGISYDISAELVVPIESEGGIDRAIQTARVILFLLRLGVNPAITLPVFSNLAFDRGNANKKNQALYPFEVQSRSFALSVEEKDSSFGSLKWVQDHWQVTQELLKKSPEFALAKEAIDQGQFIQNTTLTLVSLWGALEALFSPSTSELRFRVSALIASFLEKPGQSRRELQKRVAKLYDKRSAAAHGRPKHDQQHLLETFNLLRNVLFKIIENGYVPNNEQLDIMLFGSES